MVITPNLNQINNKQQIKNRKQINDKQIRQETATIREY